MEQICAVFELEATPFRARSVCRARNEEENGVKNTRQPEGTSEAVHPRRVRDISVRYSAPVFGCRILERERRNYCEIPFNEVSPSDFVSLRASSKSYANPSRV